MKARVATVLSLTGVLVAGSAAALVNTQVLRSAAPASNTIVQLVDEASTTSGASTSADVSTSASVTTVTTAPAASLKAFKVGDSGTVILDTAGDVLRIESAKAADGWTVIALDQVDGLNVLVSFQKGDDVVDFRSNLLFGKVTPSVSIRSSTTQGTATSSSGATENSTNTSTGNSTSNSTQTTVDDDDHSTATTSDDDDDSGKGGGGGSDDDSSSDDD